MPPIVLEPLQVPASHIARSMAKSALIGLAGTLLFQVSDGWLKLPGVLLLLYALTGLLWYPIMEMCLAREAVTLDDKGISWRRHSLAYWEVQALDYRNHGPLNRQLLITGRKSRHVVALHHYHLPARFDDQRFFALLSERIRTQNPQVAIGGCADERS